jgi:hypothetical protein
MTSNIVMAGKRGSGTGSRAMSPTNTSAPDLRAAF